MRLDKRAKSWEIQRTAMLICKQRRELRAHDQAWRDKENLANQQNQVSVLSEGVVRLPKHDHRAERILFGLTATGIAGAYGVKNEKENKAEQKKAGQKESSAAGQAGV